MITLPEGYRIGKYTVKYFIKEGLYNCTYKIEDENGTPLFMKFYDINLVPDDIVYSELAELTENYASADIAFIVNEAAMVAALADSLIGAPKSDRPRIGFR